MAITKNQVNDAEITVARNGVIIITSFTEILDDDGKTVLAVVNQQRRALAPGQDIAAEGPLIQTITGTLWTQEVKDAFLAGVKVS